MTSLQPTLRAVASPRDHAELVESLQFALQSSARLLERLRVIDYKSYEPLAAGAAIGLMLRGAVKQTQQSMRDVASLLTTLPALLSDGPLPAESLDKDTDLEWDLDAEGAWDGEPEPEHDKFCEELDDAIERLTLTSPNEVSLEALASTCHMLELEVTRERERLRRAQQTRSKWAMITAGEEARRKALKALHAALRLAAKLVGYDLAGTPFAEQPSELQTALAVRELLFEFRADIEVLTAGLERLGVSELAVRMRDARIQLLELFDLPLYHSLRAPDRFALQQFRERVSLWLDGSWDDADRARETLSDLGIFVDLLGGINARELLVRHDQTLVESARTSLRDLAAMAPLMRESPWPAYVTSLRELRRARYRNENLDHFVARELRRGESEAGTIVERIEAALEVLAAVRF